MKSATKKSKEESPASKPAAGKAPDIAAASVPDMLATLKVNPDTGLTGAEVESRRKEHGYNEVAMQKGHPVIDFLRKFWGISAWMLELIMILSAVLGKYTDLVVVSALLIVNAVLSFAQERRCRRGRDASEAVTGQCTRPARCELAGHSRSRIGSRRHRPRAAGRHHSCGCKAHHR